MARTNRQQLRRALMRLASEQRGYFSAAQARGLGYSYQAQKFHVDHGNWLRVDRGIFRIPEWPVSEDDQLVRWSLWSKGKAVVSHATALAAHNLGDVDPARVHLTVPANFRAKVANVVLHRGKVADSELEDRGGYRMTTAARAIAESTADGMGQEIIDSAVIDGFEQGVVTTQRLRRAAAELGRTAELGVERALRAAGR